MWKTVELKDICQDFKKDIVDGPFGANLKSEHFQEEGIPVLKIQNVKEFALNRKKMVYISQKKYQELRRHNFQSGDLIMTKLGAPLGVTAIVDDPQEGVIVADLVRIRIDETEAIGRFIEYQLNSASIRKQINSAAKGATRPRITLGVVRTLKLLLPPLPEQQRIVAKLDAAFAEIDKAIDVAESKYTEVEKLKAALLASALRGEEWKTVKLKDICTVFTDGDWIETKDQSVKGIRLVQTGNVKTGIFADRKEKARYISQETFERLNCTEVKQGDILVSRLPQPVGRACVIPSVREKMITAVDCTVIRTKEDVLPTYLNYYMQSPQYFALVRDKVTGATRQRISRKNLGEIAVTLPPLPEQQRIVAKLDAAFAEIDKSAESISEAKAHYLALKSAILAQELQPPESKAA